MHPTKPGARWRIVVGITGIVFSFAFAFLFRLFLKGQVSSIEVFLELVRLSSMGRINSIGGALDPQGLVLLSGWALAEVAALLSFITLYRGIALRRAPSGDLQALACIEARQHVTTLGVALPCACGGALVILVVSAVASTAIEFFIELIHYVSAGPTYSYSRERREIVRGLWALVLIGGVVLSPGILAGVGLLRHNRWARTLALLLCIPLFVAFPLGTILGVYVLWVLLRPPARELFPKPPSRESRCTLDKLMGTPAAPPRPGNVAVPHSEASPPPLRAPGVETEGTQRSSVKRPIGDRLRDAGFLFRHSLAIAGGGLHVLLPTIFQMAYFLIWITLTYGALIMIGLDSGLEVSGNRYPWVSVFYLENWTTVAGSGASLFAGGHARLACLVFLFSVFVLLPFGVYLSFDQRACQSRLVYDAARGRSASYWQAWRTVHNARLRLAVLAFVELLLAIVSRKRHPAGHASQLQMELSPMRALSESWDLYSHYAIPAIVIEQTTLRGCVPILRRLADHVPAVLLGVFGLDYAGNVIRRLLYPVYLIFLGFGALFAYYVTSPLEFGITISWNAGSPITFSWVPILVAIYLNTVLAECIKHMVSATKTIYFTLFYTSVMRPDDIAPKLRGELLGYLRMESPSTTAHLAETGRAQAIELACPHCGHQLRIKARYAGKQGRCKHCGSPISVPGVSHHQSASAPRQWFAGLGFLAGSGAICMLFAIAVSASFVAALPYLDTGTKDRLSKRKEIQPQESTPAGPETESNHTQIATANEPPHTENVLPSSPESEPSAATTYDDQNPVSPVSSRPTIPERQPSRVPRQALPANARHLGSTRFPGGGIPNNNGYIGPFCCTGETATVFAANGQAIGYAYYYGLADGAVQLGPGRTGVPGFKILVSGPANLNGSAANQAKSELLFNASNFHPGASTQTRAGTLLYSATVEAGDVVKLSERPFIDMSTVQVRIDAWVLR
ncbi:MAG: hypothetical protein HY706_00200 [Candidatus Hydrogenedentes bacterium]|nr:hypothetical protein [Candidatus Hydrogenedentota bacterium]